MPASPECNEKKAKRGPEGSAAGPEGHLPEPVVCLQGTDIEIPFPPEPHVTVWREYLVQARADGVFEVLKSHLVELSFPVRRGMGADPEYQAVKRSGFPAEGMKGATGLVLSAPEDMRLFIHESPAGPIPVILASTHDDFASLVRALTLRNEPRPIPESMGSLMVTGYNNWGRIRRYRSEWERKNPEGDWAKEFQTLKGRRELYQDAFMILSEGPYSNVPAHVPGLPGKEWRSLSRAIRLEHEATHYFTKRLFGTMTRDLYHEIVADFMGITYAVGTYRADWALAFLGLEDYPRYRKGGRLENYAGRPATEKSFRDLARVARKTVRDLESVDLFGDDEEDNSIRRSRILQRLLAPPRGHLEAKPGEDPGTDERSVAPESP